MADHFEQAKDDILRRTAGNGGPTPLDLLDALQGLADDMDEKHERDIAANREIKGIVSQHLKEAARRDERIGSVEAKMARYEEECPARLESIIVEAVRRSDEKHEHRHEKYVASMTKPRRKGDTNGKDWRKEREESRQVWLMWMVGSKVTYILIAVLITALNILLHYVLMGEP